MGKSSKKILFVTSYSTNIVGGHFISVITIAREMARLGYDVGVLMERPPVDWPEIHSKGIEWHFCKYGKNFFSNNSRRIPFIISVLKSKSYNFFVACDADAIVLTIIPAIFLGISLIQFYLGGKLLETIPPKLPGIVVFSEELAEGFKSVYKIEPDYIFLSAGRVDFSYFHFSKALSVCDMKFLKGNVKLLLVSRLTSAKVIAAKHLIDEVIAASKQHRIQLRIVGSGEGADELIHYVEISKSAANDNIDIQFLGNYRVNGADLRQADLVIGQGRTVVEAIASGVPAAVCGADGYFGMIDINSYDILKKTNFTGREIQHKGNLLIDIGNLGKMSDEFDHLYNAAFMDYDVSNGAQAVIRAMAKIETYFDSKMSKRFSYITQFYFYAVRRVGNWIKRNVNKKMAKITENDY